MRCERPRCESNLQAEPEETVSASIGELLVELLAMVVEAFAHWHREPRE